MKTLFEFETEPFQFSPAGRTALAASATEEAESTPFNSAVGPQGDRNGLESVALRLAIALNYRDENQLSNLIFFARHPERMGRALATGEPNFGDLSREWIQIRNTLVRPLLAGPVTPIPSHTGTTTPSGGTASAPPVEGPYSGITGGACPKGRGKCWKGAKSRDIVDSDAPWNKESNRSAANYARVLDYFNVGTCQTKASCLLVENPRYRRTATSTYCNIYVHDVTRALWASIPHWVRNPARGNLRWAGMS